MLTKTRVSFLSEALKRITTTKSYHTSKIQHTPFYKADDDLESYERDVMGTSFRQYIPTSAYSKSTEAQIKLLEAYSDILKHSTPETMMAYETFTNIIYPPNKFASFEKELNMKLKLAKQQVEQACFQTNSKQLVSYRMTLTGRSGDGKTFFLHRLAETNNDCIVVPLHASSARITFGRWIEKKILKQSPAKGAELSYTIVKGCEEILVSYLVELDRMIEKKCGGLELLFRFNNDLTSTVVENVEINNVDTTLEMMAKQIFQKTVGRKC